MICAEAKKILSPYLEGDLDSNTKKLLDEHLAICHDCSRELDKLKSLISALKAFPKIEPPQDFLESVRRRLDKPPVLTAALRRMFVPLHIKLPLEALTITATVIIIFFLVHRTEIAQFNPPLEESREKDAAVIVGRSITKKEARQLYKGRPAVTEEGFSLYPQEGIAVDNKAIISRGTKGAFSAEGLYSQDIAAGQYGISYQNRNMTMRDSAVSKGMQSPPTAAVRAAGTIAPSFGIVKINNDAFEYNAKQAIPGHQVINGYPAISLAELELVIKSRDLSKDSLELETILKGLQVVNLSKDKQENKIIFKFSLLSFQWPKLLSELKNWQIEKISARELPIAGRPYSVKIVLTLSP